jgi:hypothetical protein
VALVVLDREAIIGRSLLMGLDVALTMADISVVLNLEIVADVRFLRGLNVVVRELGRSVLPNREMLS